LGVIVISGDNEEDLESYLEDYWSLKMHEEEEL